MPSCCGLCNGKALQHVPCALDLQALLQTSMLQRKAQLHERAQQGEYRPVCKEEEHEAEMAKGLEERERLVSFLQQDDLQAALKPALEHMLMECLAVE